MVHLSFSILMLLSLASLLAFFFPFFKDKVYRQIHIKSLVSDCKLFILSILPLAGILALAQLGDTPAAVSLPCYLVPACLYFLLSRVRLPPLLTGVLLWLGSL